MMKALYIYYDLTSQNTASVGILKKVFAQHKLFNQEFDGGCDLLNLPLRKNYSRYSRALSYLFSKNTFDLSAIAGKSYDFVYIRRVNPNCRSVMEMLRLLKQENPSCKIVYEIPTYPYDFEHNTFGSKVILAIDRIYRKKLRRYVDKMVTLTDDKVIFGCDTLKITNGVDTASIPVCKKTDFDAGKISLVAVAQFAFWHGYERVIKGLHEYYKDGSGGKCDVTLHLVGNGPELEKYHALVAEYALEKHVVFHGALSGDALTAVFDTTDIALCSLACHKKYIYIASELKSREYLCRGLPIVTSTKIDIVPDGFEYALRVPEDDSAVDIQAVVDFARRVYGAGASSADVSGARTGVAGKIRAFAEETCGMESAMRSVREYIDQ